MPTPKTKASKGTLLAEAGRQAAQKRTIYKVKISAANLAIIKQADKTKPFIPEEALERIISNYCRVQIRRFLTKEYGLTITKLFLKTPKVKRSRRKP